jgi:hypothetical protein
VMICRPEKLFFRLPSSAITIVWVFTHGVPATTADEDPSPRLVVLNSKQDEC